MKDIFIDTQIAKNFAAAQDRHYIELIKWITSENKAHPELNAILAVSHKIVVEYLRSNNHCDNGKSIAGIYDKLAKDDRLNRISNDRIKEFKKTKDFKKFSFTCNSEDHDHFPVVFLSNRKMALTRDGDFFTDLSNFTYEGMSAIVRKRPEELNYK